MGGEGEEMCVKDIKVNLFFVLLSVGICWGMFGWSQTTEAKISYMLRFNVFREGIQMPDPVKDLTAEDGLWYADKSDWEKYKKFYSYELWDMGILTSGDKIPAFEEALPMSWKVFGDIKGNTWTVPPPVIKRDQKNYKYLVFFPFGTGEDEVSIVAYTPENMPEKLPEKLPNVPDNGAAIVSLFLEGETYKDVMADAVPVKKGFRYADDGTKNTWTPTKSELKKWVSNVRVNGELVTNDSQYDVSLNEQTVNTENVGTTNYTVKVTSATVSTEVQVPVTITPGIFRVRDAPEKRFITGSEQPTDSTIKSWFNGKVDVINEDGKVIEEGLGSTAYEVTLKSPWNSKEVGTKTFEAEVTYIGPGYQGKLKSNQAIGKIPIEFYTITAEPAQVKKGFRHADAGEKNKWTPTAEELKTWITNVQLDGKSVTDYQVSLNGKTVDTEKVGTTDYTVTVSSAGATTEVKVPVEITPGIFQVRDTAVQRFAVGSEQPTDSTIKSWFNGKVDVVNEDGKIIEEGLGSTAYEVTLKSPWNSKEVGTKTFEAEVTYIGPGYQGKLKSNQAIGKISVEFEDSGTFVWDIPHQLGFQQAKTTSSKTQMIHRTEADWKINVTDTKEERKKWGITARLDKEFTHKKDTNKKMKNILKFQSAQHEIYTLNTDHSVPIYMTADDPPKAEDLEIKWGKDQGFYLEIPAYDYHVKGEYDATIEFALEWTY